MAVRPPYAYYQCSCSSALPVTGRRGADQVQAGDDDAADEDREFDPHAPRSAFSIYPLEYMLLCEDCQSLRCPRCVSYELEGLFCPNCLFEVPYNSVKTDGSR
jgi:dynactin-4